MLAEALAGKVSDITGALVFPSVNFGYSWVWRDIPGTISLPVERVTALLKDTASSVERYGIRLLVFINGHEANNAAMKYAIREAQDTTEVKLLGVFYPGLEEVYNAHMESPVWGGVFHADEFETSLMLAVRPDLVYMDRAGEEYPEKPPLFGMDNTMMGSISTSGVFGNPLPATREKGEAMLSVFSKKIARIITGIAKQFTVSG
jgi:creatinine amidohydrolase